MISEQEAWGPTLLRVSLGIIYVMHGWFGLAVLGPAGTAGLVTRIGYPAALAPALAWYLIVVHVVGGGLLVVGLWTRIAALLQVPIMLSAIFLVHFGQGFFLKVVTVATPAGPQPVPGGYEFALLVLVATLAVALLGPGALAIDTARATPRLVMP